MAARLSVREFAGSLGVAPRTISKWEAGGALLTPLPATQQILDAALERAGPAMRQRFAELLGPVPAELVLPSVTGGRDLEAWADDLDRALASLARQEFAAAAALLARWPTHQVPDGAGAGMLSLCGRGLMLLGDLHRDQGALVGPGSAQTAYTRAREIAVDPASPRRAAQAELALAVVLEMRGTSPVRQRRTGDLPRMTG